MDVLIAIGVGLTLLGLLGLLACVVAAIRAKSAGLDEADLRSRLRPLVAWNLGALFVSMLGLMVVVVALFLGDGRGIAQGSWVGHSTEQHASGADMDIRHLTDDFAVSPQISTEDFARLKAEGFTAVISNRPDAEVAAGEDAESMRAAAEAAGIAFYENPIVSGQMTARNVEAQRQIRDEAGGPVLAYCRSGTRSATAWALGEGDRREVDDIVARAGEAGYDLSPLRQQIAAATK